MTHESLFNFFFHFYQRKIFTFAELYLPKLGYAKRSHLMNTMVPGLKGSKMSSSDASSKIDFLDDPKEIKKKLNAAACVEGEVEGNGVLGFVRAVIIPIARIRQEADIAQPGQPKDANSNSNCIPLNPDSAPAGTLFSVDRPEKFGGPLFYSKYEDLEKDFAEKKLHPADLKNGLANAVLALLEPIRKDFENDADFREAESLSYPKEEVVKKVKVKKGE